MTKIGITDLILTEKCENMKLTLSATQHFYAVKVLISTLTKNSKCIPVFVHPLTVYLYLAMAFEKGHMCKNGQIHMLDYFVGLYPFQNSSSRTLALSG